MAKHGRTVGFMVIVVLMVSSLSQSPVHGAPQVPCFFIFGDSLADNGNNNNIPTVAKVNYPPYGIDFPAGATGRFTNGRTTVDILAQLLGFEKPIPPAISTQGRDILHGLNYASGSAGIRSETGRLLGTHFSLDAQLVNHGATKARIATLLGSLQAASDLLSKCLYSVGMGSNDYLNNYYVPDYGTGNQYTPEQYATVLINQYSQQIRTLYKVHGARKVALIGLGPIGCAPNSIAKYGTKGAPCVDNMNSAVQLFNQKLVALVDQLNAELTDAKFIYVNSFGMAQGDPAAAGFKVVNEGCCTVSMVGQCIADKAPCPNRNEYVFWDGFHPTEASNTFTANRTYTNAQPDDTHPMDISHLVQLAL